MNNKTQQSERKNMYNIRVDLKKNRLYVCVGESGPPEMKGFLEKLERSCGKLLSGFTCIAEIPKSGSFQQQYQDLLFSTEDLIVAFGVSKVVRVTNNKFTPDVLEDRGLDNAQDYQVEYVSTLDEAEELLDKKL